MSKLLAMVFAGCMAVAAGGCASDMQKDEMMKKEEMTKKEEMMKKDQMMKKDAMK
ncbi:MAG: hypothetical protein HYS35_02810 [Betaproteobacteria bacterium]|nr:hypothetical protein [Betaproteobacteria bacterium]